ncbi:DNA polymerase beta domain protein region [Natranaerobius thermophilus JW/NM-WN-LF]|uniref:DNA polymerase beta domain protein region n=2 Tax=Natranaerobius TaxID=375928 RepID=B2A1R9_NATTJ|nr:DNA polymerase beta domain protein region [Natranaerobius thermophilus JW/NM-WN-LF]
MIFGIIFGILNLEVIKRNSQRCDGMTKLFDDLSTYFSQFGEIKAAYLFGSCAVGRNNSMSDIDIAVLLKDGTNNHDKKIELLAGLVELGYDNVDLAILNDMSIVGRYEVIKHNKILYADDDFDVHSYFSLVIRQYLDFKPYLEVQRKYLKERIMNGE